MILNKISPVGDILYLAQNRNLSMPRKKGIPLKNKPQTKRYMIAAIGELLRTYGYQGLKVNKLDRLGKKRGFSKKLIYDYFKTLDNLIEEFVIEKDYWMTYNDAFKDLIQTHTTQTSQILIATILQNQFRFFYQTKEMQELIRWELTGESELMKSIHRTREMIGQDFLALADPHFAGTSVNINAVCGLLVAGTYYTNLHREHNGGMFCDLDLNTKEGTDAIIQTIGQVVGWAYKAADEERRSNL